MRDKVRGNLLAKVGVLSAVPIVILGIVLGQYLASSVRDRALANAQQTATIAARIGIEPLLTRADLVDGLTPERLAEIDGALHKSDVLGSDIARIKIWSRDLEIVYSDDTSSIGRTFAASDELEHALEGNVVSEVSDLSKAENVDDRQYGQLLEVYVPLYIDSDPQPAGAFEIYLPYRPIAAAIADDARHAYALLLAGLGVLYLVLFRIVARASRTLRRQAAANEYMALHDQLTDLPNRTLFQERAQEAIDGAQRAGSRFAVILLDLDQFKDVNDTLGHPTGDELLRQLGSRLHDVIRDVDTIARFGGDEFALLLPSISTAHGAAEVATRTIRALREPFDLGGLTFEVDASLGVVLYPEHGEDVGVLLQRADVAMYAAKNRKTGFEFYSSEIDSYSPERLVLLGELRRAIADDELVLHYQPEIDMASRRIKGVEALVRWEHPTRGLVPPDEFIPLAEHTELIGPLTTWVLDHALAQCHYWQGSGLQLSVAVNISPRNLHHPDFGNHVGELLRKWNIDPARLQLEMTEGSVMTDPARAMTILTELRNLGVSLAIDDFGTGYSSLSYLQRLPVNDIKIDKSFVMNMGDDVNDAVIVRSTIELAHNLGLGVIAEGVETKEAWNQLAALGCDVAQGFLMCRPVPADELSAWIATTRQSAATPAS